MKLAVRPRLRLLALLAGFLGVLETVTRPITGGQDVGEDGVKFSGTVYVLTVTQ